MRKLHYIYGAGVFFLCFAAAATASWDEFEEVPVTRWVEGGGATLKTVEEIRASWRSDIPFFATPVRPPSRQGEVCCLVVNEALYPNIEARLNADFVSSLESEGFTVNIFRSAGGEPEDLRNFLKGQFHEAQNNFTAIFIGDLPVAMFEIPGGWNNGQPFPCDLFYLDLDGVWKDEGYTPDVYDVHEGNVEADIRFGRLTAGPLTYSSASEADLVNHYFGKNAAFRSGRLRCRDKALCYVDDDWEPWGPGWSNDMRLAYPDTEGVYDPYTTWDTDYEARLRRDYEFIQVCSHSNPALHSFYRPGNRVSYTYMTELYNLKPVALFYNLFACSNARFTSNDYMAGWYTFMDNDYGLAAVGPTKTGGMLHFDDFYRPLGGGDTLGEAFRFWLAKWADSNGNTSRDWHYGMTIIGDPTLRIRPDYIPVLIRDFSARDVGRAVVLQWDYERAFPVRGFNLYRTATYGAPPTRVNARLVAGEPPLRYVDTDVPSSHTYTYELEAVTDATREIVATTRVNVKGEGPTSFALAALAPNPAVTATTIDFSIPGPTATLAVYDAAGRKVRGWEGFPAGKARFVWHLEDDVGRPLPAGFYVVRLRSGRNIAATPLVILKR